LNEFAVNPTKPRGAGAAMIVTPVANCASASRNRRSATARSMRGRAFMGLRADVDRVSPERAAS